MAQDSLPSQRFNREQNETGLKINPIYLLRSRDDSKNRILIFLFPQPDYIEGVVVLNEEANWILLNAWSLDLNIFLE